ncbi:MAG: hypothetical protein GXY77_18330 [Fibrobacter sp.]|nr:hypothetical protein [Fibrobacter sp.]
MVISRLFFPFVFLITICYCNCKHGNIYGTFDVIESISFPVSALSEKEINTYIGKQVIIENRYAVFNEDTFCISHIVKDTLITKTALSQVKSEIEKKTKIQLPPVLIGMTLYCNEEFWESFPNYFLILNTNTILSIMDGVVFILKRKE